MNENIMGLRQIWWHNSDFTLCFVALKRATEEKLIQHRLRWFVHVQRRPPEAPVRNGVLERIDNVKRGRGRPKLTWDESVKRDLKDWNISKET